jgi:3-methyladenine DNA glycosylase Tag
MPTAPEQITPRGLGDYLEIMTKAAFQSGISWKVIEAKWDGFREAFSGFDPDTIADFAEEDVERLVQDTRIVRNRRKIEATIHNAETMLRLDGEMGFVEWLRSFDGYDDLVKAIRKEFKFMGPSGIYFWLYVVGEEVPDYREVFGG